MRWRALAERFRALDTAHLPPNAAAPRRYSWTLNAGIGVINVSGVLGNDFWTAWLGGTAYDEICGALRQARDDNDCHTILMVFDSGGGTCELLPETSDLIRDVAAAKRVVGIVRPFCASAALWLAAQCSELVITQSGSVGSIGCFLCHVNTSRMNDRIGVVPSYIFSDVSPFKTEGNADEVLTDQARAYYQEQVNRIGAKFVDSVARGRKVTPATVHAKFGGGRMLDAQAALRAGLVDRVETIETLTARLFASRRGSMPMSASDRDAVLIAIALGNE